MLWGDDTETRMDVLCISSAEEWYAVTGLYIRGKHQGKGRRPSFLWLQLLFVNKRTDDFCMEAREITNGNVPVEKMTRPEENQ